MLNYDNFFLSALLTKYIPIQTAVKEIKTLIVINSFKKMYPKTVPKIGIKYETWDWKIKPFFTKILNLNNQAIPVETNPK